MADLAGNVSAIAVAMRWEWFRLSRRLAFRVIIGMVAAAVYLLLAGSVLIWTWPGSDDVSPSVFALIIHLTLTVVGPFLGIFLTAVIFSGEYGWGTMRALLARGNPRQHVAVAKMLVIGVILALVWLVSWGLAVIAGIFAGEPGAPNPLFFNDAPAGWWAISVMYFSTLPAAIAYMSLTALLCVVGRSTTFGLAVAAAILIAESTAYPVAAIIAEGVYDFPLGDYLRWTLRGTASGLYGFYDDVSPWYFAPVVLAYIALFWALTLTLLSRRDLSGGGE